MINTLAYYSREIIAAVKYFVWQDPRLKFLSLFQLLLFCQFFFVNSNFTFLHHFVHIPSTIHRDIVSNLAFFHWHSINNLSRCCQQFFNFLLTTIHQNFVNNHQQLIKILSAFQQTIHQDIVNISSTIHHDFFNISSGF